MGGREKEAAREFKRVLRQNPKDVDALFQLARLRLAVGKAGSARRLLARCARLDRGAKWSREIVRFLRRLDTREGDGSK